MKYPIPARLQKQETARHLLEPVACEVVGDLIQDIARLEFELASIKNPLTGGDDYCSNCGSQLTDSEAAVGVLCVVCKGSSN